MISRDDLAPLIEGDPRGWRGLPQATRAQLDGLFGSARDDREATLGHFPARRLEYVPERGELLVAWERDGAVVMVESSRLPPITVLAELPEPTAVLAQEILVPDAYAHEYLYCPTGLVLTVAQTIRGTAPERIVRMRGVAPLARQEDFGPAYYLPFDDRVQWAPIDS